MNRREVLIGGVGLAACAQDANGQAQAPGLPIRRGVNLAALEAPTEGEWGYRIQADHLIALADAGFDGVRLPVRWDQHAQGRPGYRIDPSLFARVDEVIGQALARGLKVQLDIHHFGGVMDEPQRHAPRVAELWRQIGEHYGNAPADLVFEVINELHGGYWKASRTTALYREAIAAIRESNPGRLIVIGPPDWNSINGLHGWTPPDDAHLAISVHYYGPHDFTHQNGEWLEDPPTFGRAWGTSSDMAEVQAHVARAAGWARVRNLPLQLGEFGVNRRVSIEQRALWLRTMREACEAHAVGWCVWDFATTFEIFDQGRGRFIPALRTALLGNEAAS
ncbi:MAG TPA: glycoside hydrolase family 5 protein [Vitreimonas sp.]|nr:glycoside hydrolase family 5 protein [Vitreimonas sp.]